jgi:hypothetical protein
MIVALSNLRANRKYLRVTAVGGLQAGLETFIFQVNESTFTTTVAFAPGEVKEVMVAHNHAGLQALVVVRSSGPTIDATMSLTGDEDWPYPGTET